MRNLFFFDIIIIRKWGDNRVDYLVNSDELTSIADAIRDRSALEGMPLVYPFDFANEILNIPQEYDEDFIKALIERTFT